MRIFAIIFQEIFEHRSHRSLELLVEVRAGEVLLDLKVSVAICSMPGKAPGRCMSCVPDSAKMSYVDFLCMCRDMQGFLRRNQLCENFQAGSVDDEGTEGDSCLCDACSRWLEPSWGFGHHGAQIQPVQEGAVQVSLEVEEEAHSPFAKETPQDASALKVKRRLHSEMTSDS
eukprot:s2640_g7.t1